MIYDLDKWKLSYEDVSPNYKHTDHLPDVFWVDIGVFVLKNYLNVLWGRVLLIEAYRIARLEQWD